MNLPSLLTLHVQQRPWTSGKPTVETQDEGSTIDLRDGYPLRCNLGNLGNPGNPGNRSNRSMWSTRISICIRTLSSGLTKTIANTTGKYRRANLNWRVSPRTLMGSASGVSRRLPVVPVEA